MNEEIDEADFYHQDFTTASDWEIFVARMEEIIHQWKSEELKDSPKGSGKNLWDVKTESITFVDSRFDFSYYKKNSEHDESTDKEKDIKNNVISRQDFVLEDANQKAQYSCLASWYCLSEFMILYPVNTGITNESKIKILLSSLYVAASNTNCEVPIFVQVREKWQNLFMGVYEGEQTRTNFEMVHLRRGPHYCQYLTGLLDLFKTKIISPCTIDDIIVSLQSSYVLREFGNFIWRQETQIDVEKLFVLQVQPFGVSVDPIHSITLKAAWQGLSEHSVIDSESHSDFDPMQAQKWSCAVQYTQEPLCLLGDCLTEFLQILHDNNTVYDILGDFAAVPAPENNPLDLLTEPAVPTISSLLTKAAKGSISKYKRGSSPPLSENTLVSLLYFLFPDADENTDFPYVKKQERDRELKRFNQIVEGFKGYKSCNEESLTWRLTIILTYCLQFLGGLKAFSHVWYEFVQEMRYRWEKNIAIPGLSPGFPDLRTCLLNQKLQMLNCCIDRKTKRENLTKTHLDSAQNSADESDDEFFDCSDKTEEDIKKKEKYSLWNQPVGRLSTFGDLKLLQTGDPLYIPVTQEPVLKTEDQLEEDTDVLLKLGSDQEASELRARIMSASLLSDMESFKAANPGSILEDFIRWYSPRDWIEEDELDEFGQKKGQLSPRMLLEDNVWIQMWKNAKPVPAARQKRLFDDTREAEKVLQFLDYRTMSQIGELLMPILSHLAVYRIVKELETVAVCPEGTESALRSLVKNGERISRDSKPNPKRFEVFIEEVVDFELKISQINSLQYKLNPLGIEDEHVNTLIGNLASGKEVEIEGKDKSPIGSRIVAMFTEANRLMSLRLNQPIVDSTGKQAIPSLPRPSQREFVLRVNAVKPAVYSARCPQFLRAVLNNNEFRLAGAFSEDIVFF